MVKKAKHLNISFYYFKVLPKMITKNENNICWHEHMLRIKEARELAKTDGEGIKVVVLDCGVDYTHQTICDNFRDEKGWNPIYVETNDRLNAELKSLNFKLEYLSLAQQHFKIANIKRKLNKPDIDKIKNELECLQKSLKLECKLNDANKRKNEIQLRGLHDPMPLTGDTHGTTVARIITSLAPGITMYAVRIIDDDTEFNELYAELRALKYCTARNADIVNMSFGIQEHSKRLQTKYTQLVKNNMTFVASAGNEMFGAHFPSSYRNVLSVASVDCFGFHSNFSNVWAGIGVSAPGQKIFLKSGDSYEMIGSGTSFAAPMVSGVLAIGKSMLRKNDKTWLPGELESILKETACNPYNRPTKTLNCMLSQWVDKYDSAQEYFKKSQDYPDKKLTKSMYGAGIVRADKFIKKLKEYKGIK